MKKKNILFSLAALFCCAFTSIIARSIQDLLNEGNFAQYYPEVKSPLKTLNLSGLGLTSIEGIKNLPDQNIGTLILKRNQLSDEGLIQQISEALPQLQILNISSNPNIINLDPHIFIKLPKLSRLHATHTNIATLDNALFTSLLARKKPILSEFSLLGTPFFNTYKNEFVQVGTTNNRVLFGALITANIESFLALKKTKDALSSSQHPVAPLTKENLAHFTQLKKEEYLTSLAGAAVEDDDRTITINHEEAGQAIMTHHKTEVDDKDDAMNEQEAAEILTGIKTDKHQKTTPPQPATNTTKPNYFSSEAFNQRRYQHQLHTHEQHDGPATPPRKKRKVERQDTINLDENDYTINLDEDDDFNMSNNESKGKGKAPQKWFR